MAYYLTAYAIAVAHGFRGSEEEWLASLRGAPGKSAYEVAVECGYTGTKEEWLETLKGQSDLPVAQATTAAGYDSYSANGDNLPVVQKASGQTEAVGVGKQIVFLPGRANLTTAPVLKLNNGETVEIRLRAAEEQSSVKTLTVPVGALMEGTPYTLTFDGTYWLIDSVIGGIGGEAERVTLDPVTIGSVSYSNVQDAMEAAAEELGNKLDEDDVEEVSFVTSDDAVSQVDNDEAPITPAGVKAIVDEYGGDAQNIKVFDLDDVSYAALVSATEDAKTAIFLAYNVGEYQAETYDPALLLLPLDGFAAGVGATFEQDTTLVTYTSDNPPVAKTVRKTVRVTISTTDVIAVEITPTRLDNVHPAPIQLTLAENFYYTAEIWSKNKSYTAGDHFYNNQTGSAGVIGIPQFYVCNTNFTGDGTSLTTRLDNRDVSIVGPILSLPAGLTSVAQYTEAISYYTMKLLFGQNVLNLLSVSQGVATFSVVFQGALRTIVIAFNPSTGDILYIAYGVAML